MAKPRKITSKTPTKRHTQVSAVERGIRRLAASANSTKELVDALYAHEPAGPERDAKARELLALLERSVVELDAQIAELTKRKSAKPSRNAATTAKDMNELTFGEFVDLHARKRDCFDLAAVAAAREHASDGELEIDENAVTSRGDDEEGCYVMAWYYVSADEIKAHLPKRKRK